MTAHPDCPLGDDKTDSLGANHANPALALTGVQNPSDLSRQLAAPVIANKILNNYLYAKEGGLVAQKWQAKGVKNKPGGRKS